MTKKQEAYKRWYDKQDKKSLAAKQREYNRTHKDSVRSIKYKAAYGIDIKAYGAILLEQNGVCAICGGVNPGGKRLSVDHNHETGRVRGLLCHRCNAGIGMFKENIELFSSAVSYLKEKN